MVVNPHVSSIPCSGTEEKGVEFPGLFTACAVTQAMSRDAKGQVDVDTLVEREETFEGVAGTFLCDENKDCLPMASAPALEDLLHT